MKDDIATAAPPHPAASVDGPWLLWQVIDSAFPTGGFAHSGGIEAAYQHGLIEDGDSLRLILRAATRQLSRSAVPLALAVLNTPTLFESWDSFCDATLTNHVANRASRAQGRALLSTAATTFEHPGLHGAHNASRTAESACHLPTVFGLVAGVLNVSAQQAARAFLFTAARGLLSAAVRLGVVGPLEAQQLQAQEAGFLEGAAQAALHHPPEQVTQTAPMLELLQATQDRLYSRLFQS